MNSEKRNQEPSTGAEAQLVATDVDFSVSDFGEWLEHELAELVEKHVQFSTVRSNTKFFQR